MSQKNVTLNTNRSSEARTNRESVQQALRDELENLDQTFAHCAPVNLQYPNKAVYERSRPPYGVQFKPESTIKPFNRLPTKNAFGWDNPDQGLSLRESRRGGKPSGSPKKKLEEALSTSLADDPDIKRMIGSMNEEQGETEETHSAHPEDTDEEARIRDAERAANNALKKKLAKIEANKNQEPKKKNAPHQKDHVRSLFKDFPTDTSTSSIPESRLAYEFSPEMEEIVRKQDNTHKLKKNDFTEYMEKCIKYKGTDRSS
eukprot:gb/GECG01015862.1/.p1 GENE.gb/GECG01015862.1/~~gb/GECG01015862.1/.p1  ORF type:complete len:259 (+),score=41.77 gb/GECG01015862.1/:1-777(+)